MSDSKKNVCFHWVNKGKCKFGNACKYFHPEPQNSDEFGTCLDRPQNSVEFGTCLDFTKSLHGCKGPEFCLYRHKVGTKYSKNPCQHYVAGYCGLGWSCPGDHCALQAAAALTSRGVHPPQFLQSRIEDVDGAWSRELDNLPINGLRFLAVLQQIFMLLIPDKRTSRGLAGTIAEYAIDRAPYHLCVCGDKHNCVCAERSRWKSADCTPYISEEILDAKKDCFLEVSYSFPGFSADIPGCSFCNRTAYGSMAISLGRRGMAIGCILCVGSSRGSRDEWTWKNGIPVPSTIDATFELFGCSNKDRIVWQEESLKKGDFLAHNVSGSCIRVVDFSREVVLHHLAGLCDQCKKK